MSKILPKTQTTVAYRCPKCGAGVMSVVGLSAITADMVKLKCTCQGSEMSVVKGNDDSIRLTVPCLLCEHPHSFTVSRSLFFDKDLFVLPCPYSDINIGMLGEINHVKAELSRTELELLDIMEENGIDGFGALHGESVDLPDPEVLNIVNFVIKELDEEGKIYCRCNAEGEKEGDKGEYDVAVTPEGVRVSCKKCGATRTIPTDSGLGAHAFFYADSLHLNENDEQDGK